MLNCVGFRWLCLWAIFEGMSLGNRSDPTGLKPPLLIAARSSCLPRRGLLRHCQRTRSEAFTPVGCMGKLACLRTQTLAVLGHVGPWV
jgi:hypothetical protein